MTEQSGFADINGAKIYYEVAGGGVPLVLIHAGICDSRMWDDQFQTFTQDYRVVRYDQRAFGKSKPVAGTFSDLDDLRALLDFLKIDRAHLVGCSKGGSLAMDFCVSYPDRVQSLVMVGSNPSGFVFTGDPPPVWEQLKQAWDSGAIEKVCELEVQLWVDGVSRTPDQVDSDLRQKVYAMNLIPLQHEKAGTGGKQERPDVNAIEYLNAIRVPVLAIVGDLDDTELIAAAKLMADTIPNAQHVIITGTAHVPNMEKPAEFNHHVLDFLAGIA